ncbi:MAG: DUF3761 domain-containing protein [Rudaea sp.]
MKTIFLASVLGIGLLASTGVYAADAPAGATALCKDGTYYSNATHKGACKGHQGVKTWLDKSSDAAPAPKASAPAAATPKASTKASTKAAPAKTTAAASDSTGTPIAKCKDGTTFSGTSHRGACRGHKGVDTWLDQPAAAAAPAPAPTASKAPSKPAATPAAPAKPAATETVKTPTPSSEIQQKAGGGPGMVWVNSSSKVYHCSDDQWYGKTKEGSYMSEAAAKSAGNRAARGKECGS